VKSSSSGSAHWTSSIANTTGCSAASAESRRRTTKKISSGKAAVPESLTARRDEVAGSVVFEQVHGAGAPLAALPATHGEDAYAVTGTPPRR
jgi:hypothetical protein